MASTYLVREAVDYTSGVSNTASPDAGSGRRRWKYYETTYSSATSEAIYLPDAIFPVAIGFTWVSGTYALNYTYSPPDVIEAGNAAWITSDITAGNTNSFRNVTGPTAIQIVTTGGSTKVSIRA